MTPEEIAEMSKNAIPVPEGSNLPPKTNVPNSPQFVPQGYQYFRRCPTCGHMEMVTTPNIQPYAQVQQPIVTAPETIGVYNNGSNLEDGGAEAGWR